MKLKNRICFLAIAIALLGTTPSTAEETGRIKIVSEPRNGKVTVDGHEVGRAPLEIGKILLTKTYELKVSLNGYEDWVHTIDLAKNPEKEIKAVLVKKGEKAPPTSNAAEGQGEVFVNSKPAKAQVFIDQIPLEHTPVTVKHVSRDKPHLLEVKLDGYKTWSTTVDLNQESKKSYEVNLEKNEAK